MLDYELTILFFINLWNFQFYSYHNFTWINFTPFRVFVSACMCVNLIIKIDILIFKYLNFQNIENLQV